MNELLCIGGCLGLYAILRYTHYRGRVDEANYWASHVMPEAIRQSVDLGRQLGKQETIQRAIYQHN